MTGRAFLYYSSHRVAQNDRRESKRPQDVFDHLCFCIQTPQIHFPVRHQFPTLLHGAEPRTEFANA